MVVLCWGNVRFWFSYFVQLISFGFYIAVYSTTVQLFLSLLIKLFSFHFDRLITVLYCIVLYCTVLQLLKFTWGLDPNPQFNLRIRSVVDPQRRQCLRAMDTTRCGRWRINNTVVPVGMIIFHNYTRRLRIYNRWWISRIQYWKLGIDESST